MQVLDGESILEDILPPDVSACASAHVEELGVQLCKTRVLSHVQAREDEQVDLVFKDGETMTVDEVGM